MLEYLAPTTALHNPRYTLRLQLITGGVRFQINDGTVFYCRDTVWPCCRRRKYIAICVDGYLRRKITLLNYDGQQYQLYESKGPPKQLALDRFFQ